MSGYSIDLRERAVAAYERGEMSEGKVAALFGIGEASLRRWRRKKRETGSVAAAPHGGGQPRLLTAEALVQLRDLVARQSDLTDTEFIEAFVKLGGRRVSPATMNRYLRRLGLTRKKSSSSRPSNSRRGSKRSATVFLPGRKPYVLRISSSSTKRGATSE